MKAITVDNLRKSYQSGVPRPVYAVDGVSFDVAPGEIFGLLGPNGAGKTTLVKILTTITPPSSGQARIMGYDVVRQALDVRRQLAVVLQQTAVDNLLTVEDNLRIYAYLHGVSPSEVRTRMESILDEFDLREQARKTVQDLSLGTKRRVQVAKIFMVDSPVIFLDESTTGMDPMMRRRVLDRIRREARNGRAVLLTTQVLSEAEELCDRIMIIHHGKTLAAGSLQDLRRLSTEMFRVSFTVASGHDVGSQLKALQAVEMRIDGERVELLFKQEESRVLAALAELASVAPLRQVEVRGAALEDIFVELIGNRDGEPEGGR
ncbi:MAG: ABC transporter ATP-binding protein [Nitrospiraceae bacterium]|nr:ABC transporter ATP-binding protein [Nitrospiraceae bacterium]